MTALVVALSLIFGVDFLATLANRLRKWAERRTK